MKMTQTVSLGDVVQINPSTPLKKRGRCTFVSMDKLAPFKRKINLAGTRSYTGGSKFMNDDTLLARITPCLENGKTAYVDILEQDEIGAGSTEFIVMRAIQGVTDSNYVYYLATSPEFRSYAIQAMIGTSGRQRVQNDVLAKYTFELPDLAIQQEVGKQLQVIDEKIELNRKMNETLQQIGQVIFRHYFIGNPDSKRWESGVVANYASHGKVNVNPSKNPETMYNQYSIPAFDNSMAPESTLGADIKSNKYSVADWCILVSKLNPATPRVWPVIAALDNAVCSTEFQVIIPKNYFSFVYFLLTSREYTDKMAMMTSGTSNSHRRINPSDILNYTFATPGPTLLERFENETKTLLIKIDENRKEIQTLTTLRDTLLPRLISGKVKI